MSDQSNEAADLRPESLSFHLFIVGTLVFVVLVFWLTNMPYASGYEAQFVMAVSRILLGLQVLGCYLAFAGIIFAHKLFRHSRR